MRPLIKALAISIFMSAGIMAAALWFLTKEPSMGGNFSLNHRGDSWVLSDHAKLLNLLYVGFVKCPDVCPLSLSVVGQAFRQLTPEELDRTQLLFLSVDYEHDTPESVANYASQFYKDFIGLTGSKIQIDNAVHLFGASYMIEPYPDTYLGYSIAHTDRLFFLNSNGVLVDTLPTPRTAEKILEKVRSHL
ncbi:MAG: hypothetical protein COV44_03545 [Deltaproteobacteria bacterium CG11_big_fil_rev_8_21_14_0_20_45_16]|nr:MAG: hypothetical protein COV44_03545 [Deltaproteobacteria bacterium CG11_big_fil_rev_8_21_14_0_20_45_16]